MEFNVTYITVANKRITANVTADSIEKAIEEVSKHPDYDLLAEAVQA